VVLRFRDLAVLAIVRGRKVPPRVAEDLELIALWLRTGTPPQEGGLLDQDPEWVEKVKAVVEAERLKQEEDEKRVRGSK